MTDEETERMANLTRRLADTAIDYKQRCEELEAKLAKAVEATRKALDSIDRLNTLPPDENGHCWRESDLLDQEVMILRATLAAITETPHD